MKPPPLGSWITTVASPTTKVSSSRCRRPACRKRSHHKGVRVALTGTLNQLSRARRRQIRRYCYVAGVVGPGGTIGKLQRRYLIVGTGDAGDVLERRPLGSADLKGRVLAAWTCPSRMKYPAPELETRYQLIGSSGVSDAWTKLSTATVWPACRVGNATAQTTLGSKSFGSWVACASSWSRVRMVPSPNWNKFTPCPGAVNTP